jgi:flagellar motility protein MotE (MotC chaperone)
MAKILNPVSATVIAILLGVAVGLGAYMTKAKALVAAVAARAHVTASPQEAHAKGWDFWTVEVDNLSSELKDEKARLRAESDALDLKAQRIAAEEADLEKTRASLDAMRKEINDRVVEVGADESKNLRSLAAMYSSLSPAAAVNIIGELDDATAIKILALMKPDVVGPIFEAMSGSNAHRAAVLSDKLRLIKQ